MGRTFWIPCVTRILAEIDNASASVQAAEFQLDTAVGEGQHAASELVRYALRCVAGKGRLQKVQEFGGAAGPLAALLDEGADGFDDRVGRRRWSEGLMHFLFGTAKRGAGGHGPSERVGAFSRGQVHLGEARESGANGGAEGSENGWPSLVESGEEGGFGNATGRREGRKSDNEGALGEVGRTGPSGGDVEEHGALVVLQQRLGSGPGGLVGGCAETGGEAAEGIGEGRGEGGDVVEGEDPVVAGEGEEIADGGGDGGEGRGAGIDEIAEEAGGEGLAGGGGTLEDEEGVGSMGAEGGEEPGEAAEPGGAGGEVEAGAKGLKSRGRGLGARGQGSSGRGSRGQGPGVRGAGTGGRGFRRRRLGCGEWDGGAGSLEERLVAGGGLPTVGRDLDKLAIGIAEVE